MIQGNLQGKAYYATATGYFCVSSGPAQIIGVLVHGSATGGFQIFTSNTATAATAICGVVSASGYARFIDMPLDVHAGFCVRNVPSLDPKLTLFWVPMATS